MVRQRNAYDFVKVKVLLCADGADGGATRGYVLSRFLLCRQLTAIGVPHAKAVKIALELKKRLVDEGRLEVSHAEMEACLLEGSVLTICPTCYTNLLVRSRRWCHLATRRAHAALAASRRLCVR